MKSATFGAATRRSLLTVIALVCTAFAAFAQSPATDRAFNIGKQDLKIGNNPIFIDSFINVYAKLAKDGSIAYSAIDPRTHASMPITIEAVAKTTSGAGTSSGPVVFKPLECRSTCVAHDAKGACTKYQTVCKKLWVN